MKKSILLLFLLISQISWSQDYERITIPNFSDYVLPHYADENGVVYCSAKLYENNVWRNYLATYDANQGTIELVDPDWYKTSNSSGLSFYNFMEFGNYVYFIFGSVLYRVEKGSNIVESHITNFEYAGVTGKYLIYNRYTDGVDIFTIYDLEAEQPIDTFTTTSADEFYLHNNSIYFFAEMYNLSVRRNYIYKYNLSDNSLSELYSCLIQENPIDSDQWTRMERVGDNLIYNVRDDDDNATCISINLNDDSINSDFTFIYGNTFALYQRDMFVVNDEVFINNQGIYYKSNGIDQPEMTDLNFNTTYSFLNSIDGNYLNFDGKVFGPYQDPTVGTEIHYTDGQSSYLLKDIIPGIDDGNFRNAHIYDGKFYFHETISETFYMSDGTENGTQKLFDIIDLENFGRVQHYEYKTFFYGESDTEGNGMYMHDASSLSTSGDNLTDRSVKLWSNGDDHILNYRSSNRPLDVRVFDILGREMNVSIDFENQSIQTGKINGIHIVLFEFEFGELSKKVLIK